MDTPEMEPSEEFARDVASALREAWKHDTGVDTIVEAGPVVVVSTNNFSFVLEVHAVRKGSF